MITTTEYTCTICQDTFTLQTGEVPAESPEGEILCEDCLCDHYHYSCMWCGDCEHIEEQHRAVVVWDAAEAGVGLPGLYQVHETAILINAALEREGLALAVEWVGWLPPYPSYERPEPWGPLCRACLRHFRAQCALTALQGMWAASHAY
jgi:hypothetical protein